MTNGTAALDELSRVLAELKHDYAEAIKVLASREKEIEAIEIALRFITARQSPDRSAPINPDDLRDSSQIQALMMIAKKNNGILIVLEAKRLMLQAGLFRTPRNASQIIYNIIKRSDIFERIEPGVYGLKSVQPQFAYSGETRST